MSEQVESTTETSENSHTEPPARENTAPELNRLVELSIQYPEIGPPLAELASKIGHPAIAKRIVKMGLDSDFHGVEYYYVGAHNARREQRFEDTLKLVIEAVQTFVKAETGSPEAEDAKDDARQDAKDDARQDAKDDAKDDARQDAKDDARQDAKDDARQDAKQDAQRLLHLVRLGFSTLMFELRDLDAHKGFAAEVAAGLSQLEDQLGKDAFYRTLLAQALWFDDRERSEEQWRAAESLGSPEATWNARGTWYREAERDLEKAEQAYRRGLEEIPQSALINHNLAQVLLDRAETLEDEKQKRTALNAADKYLRAALKGFSPKGLRRHIHTTRDRLFALRDTLPAAPRRRGGGGESPRREPPNPGDKLTGKVRTVASYGAFVQLPSGHTGLLHKSELAHEHVHDAADKVNEGDELEVVVLELSRDDKDRLRISLSRKALLDPPPADANANAEARPAGRGGKRPAKAKNGASRPPRGGGGGGRKRGEGRGNRDRDRDHASGGGGRDRDRDHGGAGRRESDAKRQEKQDKLASLGEMLLAKISGGDDAKE